MPDHIEKGLHALGDAARRGDTEQVITFTSRLLDWRVPFTLIAVIVAAAGFSART